MKLSYAFLAIFFISSCGEQKALNNPAESVAIGLGSAFEYELSGVDDKNETCTTGRKSFLNLHEMCLDLQKPTDYECALVEKKLEFARSCIPAGYNYRESVKCEVRLVSADTSADSIVATKSICVGQRVSTEQKESYQHIKGDLALGFSYDMELSFMNALEGDQKISMGSLSVIDATGAETMTRKIIYNGRDVQLSVETQDKRYRLEETCQRVYACEG